MKVKEESEKTGLKLNSQKTKIMASGPTTSWQIDGETMKAVAGANTCRTLPMTGHEGENLTGKADQVSRDSEKLPPALTLKMTSVFLMLASIDYSLISVTQAEGLPRSLPK